MNKIEKILILLVMIGIVMKFIHLPGASIMLILSSLTLSTIYFYTGFAFFNNVKYRRIFKNDQYKNAGIKRILGAIAIGSALSIILIGILFKFQMWPGGEVQLYVGIFYLLVIGLISLIKFFRNRNDKYYQRILIRVLGYGLISLFLILVPDETWFTWRYPNHPDYVNAIIKAQKEPNNQELWDKVDEERLKMDKEN